MKKEQKSYENKLSDFTMQVHRLISKIPSGKLVTYKDIAEKLGIKAYRAVGKACNKSPGMPSVPCHRVISSKHTLHGFASGIENKKKLLAKEGISMKRIKLGEKQDYIIDNYETYRYQL